MSDDPMRILVVEPTKDPYVMEIDGSLASMQAIVGGFIQAVEPFDDHNVLLVCNEEAKLLGLPENRFLRNRNGIPYKGIELPTKQFLRNACVLQEVPCRI